MRTLLLTLVLVATASGQPTPIQHTKDTTETIKKALAESKAVLLDVREKSEWDAGHLRDARLLPLSVLRAGVKAEELVTLAPKGTVIYCHCKAGGRCLSAAEMLQKAGYDVRPLKAGYQDLVEAGFATGPK